MKYMGSKNRIAKYILPIILKDRKPGQWYVEPFVGGGNMIDKVDGNRIGADSNKYLIAMWKELIRGWEPNKVTRGLYYKVRDNKDEYPEYYVGWVGFNCSYCGKWFDGYAGETKTRIGTIRDYQAEAIRFIKSQSENMEGIDFVVSDYRNLQIPEFSIIYCDPPYENRRGYRIKFNNQEFWDWCREKTREGHTVFVSEYSAPDDFECLWSGTLKSSLSINGETGWSQASTEKLFKCRRV